jgi:hypothetical protein
MLTHALYFLAGVVVALPLGSWLDSHDVLYSCPRCRRDKDKEKFGMYRDRCDRCAKPLEMSRTIDQDGNVQYYDCDCAT